MVDPAQALPIIGVFILIIVTLTLVALIVLIRIQHKSYKKRRDEERIVAGLAMATNIARRTVGSMEEHTNQKGDAEIIAQGPDIILKAGDVELKVHISPKGLGYSFHDDQEGVVWTDEIHKLREFLKIWCEKENPRITSYSPNNKQQAA